MTATPLWEFREDSWSYSGAYRDDWPGKAAFLATDSEDPRWMELVDQWRDWSNAEQQAWFDRWGDAGFELVNVQVVEHEGSPPLTYGWTTVHAWFKRPKAPDNPEPPPKALGFRPPV